MNTDQLSEFIAELGLLRLLPQILERCAPALRLVPGTATDGSFFGEPLELPDGFVRPSAPSGPLSSILWVRLADIAEDAARNGLPTTGWLVFLLALPDDLSQGEGPPFDGDASAVVHFPHDVVVSPDTRSFAGEFQRVSFERFVTIPDRDIAAQLWEPSAAESEAYETLFLAQEGASLGPPPYAMHYMFGHPAPLVSSALPDPDEPARTLLLQFGLHPAIGTELLSHPQVSFFTERDRPLETLDVFVE